MQRRNVLLGLGAAASGSALIGTGAFSRVESHRDVTIEVAEDPDAYLGMSGTGSTNSENYVEIDENGHLAIDISGPDDEESDLGEGVNSDSFTWFDSMVQVCNQGKEGAAFYIEELEDVDFPENIDATGPEGTAFEDEPRLDFYMGEAAGVGDDGTGSILGEANAVDIPVGECIELGVRTMTKGVDASKGTLFGDEVVLVADVDVDTDLERQQDPIRNARTREGYQTIQGAVDDAGEGDTIEVLTGTEFVEDVTIGVEELTLEATSNAKPELVGSVAMDADGVTVDGFSLLEGDGDRIVQPRDSTGTTVRNCDLSDSARGIQGDYLGRPDDLSIVENTFETVRGIVGTEDVDGLDIRENTFRTEVNAIGLGEGAENVTIEDNDFAEGDAGYLTNRTNLDLAVDVIDDNDFDVGAGVDDVDASEFPDMNEWILVSLADAVQLAAEGATVAVAPGEYEGDVSVDVTGVSVEGPNAGIPAYDDGRSDPAVVVGQVDLSADGVAFDGFDVSPDDPATGSIDNEAVLVTASDLDVLNTAVTDFGESFDENEFVDTIGIVVSAADELTDVTISGNEVTDIRATHPDGGLHGAVGISIAGDADAVVEDNVVSDIGTDTASYAWGIVARSTSDEIPSNVEILDNVIESVTSDDDSDFDGTDLFGVGFGADDDVDASNVVANDNAIDTPELLGENKDGDNELDATENWWGDEDGPDEDRLVGKFDTSEFLTSPPS